MTDDEITPRGAELIAGLKELVDVLESGEPLEDHFVVWVLRRDGADRRRAMIGVGDHNRKIEQLQTENAALRAENERLKQIHDDGPFEALATRLDAEAYEALEALGVDPGFGNCFGEASSIVNAEAKRLKGENERLKTAIREHRDQKGDDRCWLDDGKLYDVLEERPKGQYASALPPRCDFLASCERFWAQRQNPDIRGTSPLPRGMTITQLTEEVARLRREVERLTSPQIREIDISVNEELIEERDKARADLAEAVKLMHLIMIRGNLCSPDACDACEEFREFLAKHWSHP